MSNAKIKLINGETLNLDLSTPELQIHFSSWNNYTNAILDQFNTRNYYQDFIDKNDKVILDLGANIGLFAIHVAPWAERIVCLEPTPSHFKLLEQLTSEFKNIERVQVAIAPKDGKVTFYTEPNNTTMNSLIPRSGGSFQVEGYSLKTIMDKFNLQNVDFIKMDIEGSENIVLNDETVSHIINHVPKILIEFHSDHDVIVPKFISTFEANGFKVNHFHWDSIMCIKNK